MALDVLEVLESAGDLPAVDGLGGLAGVLERNTEVGTASAGGLGRLDVGGGVTDLVEEDIVRMCCLMAGLSQIARAPSLFVGVAGRYSRRRCESILLGHILWTYHLD